MNKQKLRNLYRFALAGLGTFLSFKLLYTMGETKAFGEVQDMLKEHGESTLHCPDGTKIAMSLVEE